jgi:hypothetical protein
MRLQAWAAASVVDTEGADALAADLTDPAHLAQQVQQVQQVQQELTEDPP